MICMGVILEPEERAIWQVLADADVDDRLTVPEIAAVASAFASARVDEYVVREVVGPMLRYGYVSRSAHYRLGRQRSALWAYRLTVAGRARAARLLGQ